MKKTETENLVKKAVAGSRQALETVVKQIQPPVYRLALRMLFHPQDAEDATQEILIKIITHLHGFRFESTFRSWALRIATNHLSGIRRRKFRIPNMDMTEAQNIIDRAEARGWFSDPLAAPAPFLEVEMISACTQALLQALNRNQRVAFILGAIVEVTSIEGAYILDISPAAFRKRLSRARHLIVDFLATNCGFFEKSNRCRCAGIVAGHVASNWMDEKYPVFGTPSDDKTDFRQLRDYMRELDEISKMSVMFKSYPRNQSTLNTTDLLKTCVQNDNFRILSEPQHT